MQQYIFTARQNVIDPSAERRLSDEELWGLDGIWRFPITVSTEGKSLHSIMDTAIAEFEQAHPNLSGLKYEIVKVN